MARGVFLQDLPTTSSKFRKWHRTIRDPLTNEATKVERGCSTWIIPNNFKKKARILFLHGGAYQYYSPRDPCYLHITTTIALQTGYPILAIDYRLCPEHKFPAALTDAEDALKYIWQYGPEGFGECEEVYVFGDSSGGGLALALCIKIRDNPTARMPQRLCLISPWLDLEPNPKSYDHPYLYKEIDGSIENIGDPFTYGNGPQVFEYAKMGGLSYAQAQQFSNPLVSPLQDPKLHIDLPPALIIVGEREWAFHHMALKLAQNYTNSETLIFEQMWHNFIQYSTACGQGELKEALIAHRCISTFFLSRTPLPLANLDYVANEPSVCFGVCTIS